MKNQECSNNANKSWCNYICPFCYLRFYNPIKAVKLVLCFNINEI